MRLYDEDTGGPGDPIVFSHSLLFGGRTFCLQAAAPRARKRCITQDHRSHGRSDMPGVESIDVETACDDAVALVERIGVAACRFVGLSLGSFVGMHDLRFASVVAFQSAQTAPKLPLTRCNSTWTRLSRSSRRAWTGWIPLRRACATVHARVARRPARPRGTHRALAGPRRRSAGTSSARASSRWAERAQTAPLVGELKGTCRWLRRLDPKGRQQ